ncbi:hypothetical protein CROQUDRAFT_111549 [Cronartium quercuum f. sp. fusiforme G11]|uniref:Rab-GAP TBC domain-containing protein n=1 Tax=Cronartium quercuum f. sp. fusiforme G11 TaxID=708437 RepID=A0A9P6N5F7_9BASI|nr:hypothetical protein CROQUDRAFT_111549 [Cronartium quercuum f. sp. fusiforme G11]
MTTSISSDDQARNVNSFLSHRTDRAILTYLASLPGGFACASQTRKRYQTYLVTTATGLRAPSAPLASLFSSGKDDRSHLWQVWAFILGVQPLNDVTVPLANQVSLAPHRDEGQVRLDVNRSFTSFPLGFEDAEKAHLRELLESTIVNILRRFPKLSYFQGYHDVVSIFLLTFVDLKDKGSPTVAVKSSGPDGMDFPTASRRVKLLEEVVKRFTLHRIRDSMASNLDPVMGYLRVTQAILTQEHPRLSSIIAQTSNLPLFSLSWILTLTSHDLTSFEVISRLFDFLLCHNPIMICYIACAICLTKVEQIDELIAEAQAEGEVDFDMVHFVMSKLPKLYMPEDCSSESHHQTKKTAELVEAVLTSDLPSTLTRKASDQASEISPMIEAGPESNNNNLASVERLILTTPDDSSVDQRQDEKVLEPFSNPESDQPASVTTSLKPELNQTTRPKQDGLSVESIIHSTLLLYARYPPTDPRLGFNEIFGPKSCLYTWEQSITGQLTDTEAEMILAEPLNQIVLPGSVQLRKEARRRALMRSMRRKKMVMEVLKRLVSRKGLLAGSVLIGILSIVYLRPHNQMNSRLTGIYDRLSSLIRQVF